MAGLHWEGVASCPPIKKVPTTNIKHLTLIMGGQDATPSQCNLAEHLQKNMDKQRVVCLFVCNDISYFLVETTVVVGSS